MNSNHVNINIVQKTIAPPVNVILSYPRDHSHLIITWDEVRNPDKELADKVVKKIYYNIYKSQTQNGIYYLLNNQPLSTNRYEDYCTLNPNVQNWYKVSSVYETEDGLYIEGSMSIPYCFKVHNNDKWFRKMNERNYWILENVGLKSELYVRKYDGERCPQCFNSVRGRAATQDCPICFGTGFKGGYEPPQQLFMRFKPVQTELQISNQMYVYNNAVGAWTISDIRIMNRDVIFDPQGKAFQVINSTLSHCAGYEFHQELNLKEFDPNDIIYQLRKNNIYTPTSNINVKK